MKFEPKLPQIGEQRHRKATENAVSFIRYGRMLGLVTIIYGVVILFSHLTQAETLWRPIPGGPSTAPVTAIVAILLGWGVIMVKPLGVPRAAAALFALAGLISGWRVIEVIVGLDILNMLSPFQSLLAREESLGTPLTFGWNSAAMMFMIAAAFVLRYLGIQKLGQIIGIFSICLPLISVTGYIYGVEGFYGEMSLPTSALGIVLGSSAMFLGARYGIMKVILSPWDAGRFSRIEIAVICGAVFLGGYLIQFLAVGNEADALPILVVLTGLSSVVTIGTCGIVLEKNDHQRRQSARMVTQLALYDPLTGFFNRRFLADQEEALISFARRQKYKLCVIMIDIDNFKPVNDTFGHSAGDEVIRRICFTIKSRIRRSDFAVRYGGEELLIILPDAPLADSVNVAEDLRAMIENVDFSEVARKTVTVSIGVAEVISTLSEAIIRADAALYVAKKSGRNQVIGDSKQSTPEVVSSEFANYETVLELPMSAQAR